MKYSISNWFYGDEPLETTLQRLQRYGYKNPYIASRLKRYEPFRDIYAEQCITRLRKLEEGEVWI